MTPAPITTAWAIKAPDGIDIERISAFLDRFKDKELFFYSKKTIKRMVLGGDQGRKPYVIRVATIGERIIGIAIASSKSKTLSLLFVDPEYRKIGVGRSLYFATSPKQILLKKTALPYFSMLEGYRCVRVQVQEIPHD